MPTKQIDTSIPRLQNQHRLEDIFTAIINIFYFNIFSI